MLRVVIACRGPLTLKELARQAGLPPSTSHRLLEELESNGWIVQDREACRIEIGPSLIGFCAGVSARYESEAVIRPVLRELVVATGESVSLNLLDAAEGRLVTFVVEESNRPLGYHLQPGELSYLHTGASGRAVLAFMTEQELKTVVRRHGLPRITPNTIGSAKALKAELQATRRKGYAFSRGERLQEAVGIAAPVFGMDGTVKGSLLVTIPAFRFSASNRAAAAKAAIACAQRLQGLVDPVHCGLEP